MTSHGEMSWSEAMMSAAAPALIQKAVVEGDADNGLMATGVVAGRLSDLPTCAELLARIEAEAISRIQALQPFVSSEVEPRSATVSRLRSTRTGVGNGN
jgi:hypothetical protein